MPVIQASTGPAFADFGSVMSDCLLWKTDALGHGFHVSAQIRIRERNVAEGELCVAGQFAADVCFRIGDGKARTFVNDAGVYFQELTRVDKVPHLDFVDPPKKCPAPESHHRD